MSIVWWPLLIACLILGGLAFVLWLWPSTRADAWEGVTAASTLITAAAAISIPLAIDESARNTRTLDQLNDVDRKIGEAVSAKIKLDSINGKTGNTRYAFEYINNEQHRDVQALVFRMLNDYDYLCLGANQGLFSSDIIRRLRYDALSNTWVDYNEFIRGHRAIGSRQQNAWKECDYWLHSQKLN